MDSISETLWDVVIYGTGLQESLLALSLSRSGKQILHVDPNDYYGGPEASLSLQEADTWAEQHASPVPSSSPSSGSAAAVTKQSDLPLSRAYSLALSPQVIHGRSALISQLVSSRAYRQLDFLAVGSFFVFKPSSSEPGGQEAASASPSLQRIPSTREDVFSTTAIPSRSKRSLMKFLKFVLDYDGEQNSETWRPFADKPLAEFLSSEFKLDAELLAYVHTLTLSLQRSITTKEGLAVIHRHLTSMGMFGPGFAAVYPKWGGISEVAQVACRACAVGGAVYMLSTKLNEVHNTEDSDELTLDLSNVHGGDIQVKTRLLVRGGEHISAGDGSERASRLVAVVDSPLELLFEAVVEGAPIPAVAVIAFPTGSPTPEAAEEHPIYVFAHSSQTGECPVGQSVLYFTTLAEDTEKSKARLDAALSSFLEAVNTTDEPARCLHKLYYEYSHRSDAAGVESNGKIITFSGSIPSLAFNDASLEPVNEVWRAVMGPEAEGPEVEYMKFPDRENADDYDDDYE